MIGTLHTQKTKVLLSIVCMLLLSVAMSPLTFSLGVPTPKGELSPRRLVGLGESGGSSAPVAGNAAGTLKPGPRRPPYETWVNSPPAQGVPGPWVGASAPAVRAGFAPASGGFDQCIQDDTDRSQVLQFNSSTGAFQFSVCSANPPVLLTGTGTVTTVNGCLHLSGKSGGSTVAAGFANGCTSASATVHFNYAPGLYQTYNLHNSSVSSNTCGITPSVRVTSPAGGEILDAGSTFTITWTVSGGSAISSQDLLYSTNGGSSYVAIVTGLPATATQYSWTIPTIANNSNIRVQVVEHDFLCNKGSSVSPSNLTIWNPPAAYSNTAEAPHYKVGGGYNSTIYLANISANTVNVELASRLPMGNASQNLPATMSLAPGQNTTVSVASLITPGAPSGPSDPGIVKGAVRLRYTGSDAKAIRATMVLDQDGASNTSITPFYNPALTQSSSGGAQFCGMYEADSAHSAELNIQNVTNNWVSALLAFHYGTGSGPANGTFSTPISVAPQQTMNIPVNSLTGSFQGATWGSVEVDAPAQSLVTHLVTTNGTGAFNSNAMDPTLCASNVRILSGMKMDYNSSMDCYVMVRNVSAGNTDTVNLSWTTADGSQAPPSTQVTLAPGTQSLVEWPSYSYLTPGQSCVGMVTLSFTGNCADIVAAGCSESETTGMAISASALTSDPSDGNHLISAFYSVDQNTDGFLMLKNVGSANIQAGAVMNIASYSGTVIAPLTSNILTLGPGQATTLDLQQYLDGIDGYTVTGSLEVWYTGAAGSLVASFVGVGITTQTGLGSPANGGNGSPVPSLTVFPNSGEVTPGDTLPVSVMTDGTVGTPAWSLTSTNPTPGTVAPQGGATPTVFPAVYTPAPGVSMGTDTATASAAGVSAKATITIEATKVKTFTTQQGGIDQHGRISPEGSAGQLGATTFTLGLNTPAPSGPLTVVFIGDGNSSSQPVTTSTDGLSLTGIAGPVQLLGDVSIKVLDAAGNRAAKSRVKVAYYAVDPPLPAASITPNGFNRLGGTATISISFAKPLRDGNNKLVNPSVSIGPIGFLVNNATFGGSSTPSTIIGNVAREPDKNVRPCSDPTIGQVPCYFVKVKNPGGKPADEVKSNQPLYNLLPGPAPTPKSRVPDSGESIGLTAITISGDPGASLDFTSTVTVGGSPIIPVFETDTTVEVITTPHLASANNPIIIFDIDNAAPGGTTVPGNGFTYTLSQVRKVCLFGQSICLTTDSGGFLYYVGPNEGITPANYSYSNVTGPAQMPAGCYQPVVIPQNVNPVPSNLQFLTVFTLGTGCGSGFSSCSNAGTYKADINFSLANSGAPANTNLFLNNLVLTGVTCTK